MQNNALTYEGWDDLRSSRSLCVIACGALAHELIAIFKQNGMEHVSLRCLPAILHNSPQDIPNAAQAKILEAQADGFDQIKLAYADCGTGGALTALCAELGVEMIEGPHCYAFFQGAAMSEAHDDMTSFYLTDFLVRQFDAFVWKPLGLDRHPELRDMYFQHYEKLIYLRQNPALDLAPLAQKHARALGLGYELRDTGYGDLSSFIAQ